MKKMLLLCATMLITACTIQVADATDEPEEYCYLRKLYYEDVCRTGVYGPRDYGSDINCDRWWQGACTFYDGGNCVAWEQDYYFDVEECTEVYRK